MQSKAVCTFNNIDPKLKRAVAQIRINQHDLEEKTTVSANNVEDYMHFIGQCPYIRRLELTFYHPLLTPI